MTGKRKLDTMHNLQIISRTPFSVSKMRRCYSLLTFVLVALAFLSSTSDGLAMMPKIGTLPHHVRRCAPLSRRASSTTTTLNFGINGWNNEENKFKRQEATPQSNSNNKSSYEDQYRQYQQNNLQNKQKYITQEMEDQVMASARATMDSNTVSKVVNSLIDDDRLSKVKSATKQQPVVIQDGIKSYKTNNGEKGSSNTLRNLAGRIQPNGDTSNSLSSRRISSTTYNNNIISGNNKPDNSDSTWDTQQIAIASGATTFLLSPIIIPVIHSLLPPILPFPSSLSFSGAAFLGLLAYIVALGDPTQQSMGDGVEVTGAVSRIVGRTALQSVQTSAPRLKAAARAVVDYDNTVNSMEEMSQMQYQLSRRLLELESENDVLKKEVALWNAVEDVSSVYKLEELKEIAREEGMRGYSSDGKNALLRRLIKEGVLKLDLSPYYTSLNDVEGRAL
eukprot:g10804.t1 g10804   contig4:2600069-2601412(-)